MFSANKDQNGFPKAKILDPFNTKSYAKIVLTFSSCWQQKIIPANTGNKRFKYVGTLTEH